jgi:hypothetical protein
MITAEVETMMALRDGNGDTTEYATLRLSMQSVLG